LPTSDRLTVLQGNILDPAAVQRAVDSQDAVISTISAPMSRQPTTVFSDGIRNVLAAMASTPNAQLLAVTGIGAGDSAGHGGVAYDRIFMPLMLRRIYDDKDREEALIRASAVNWMIVRPGFLNDGPERTDYRVVSSLSGVQSGSLSRASVAHFLITAVETGAATRRTILLTH
jgi:putative NADH-flavin reductase